MVDRVGTWAFAGAVGAWAVVLGRILQHRVYVSHDTVINYAHVWFVSDRLWRGDGVPLRMPGLGHGEAVTFPYGFLPWSLAALARPVFGDWSVTLLLVAITVGVMIATFWAFPELRQGWCGAAVLLEPAMVTAPLIGQIPFLSGMTLLLVAVGAWRRDRRGLAIVAAGLAQATHPAIVLPLALGLVAGWLRWEPRRRALATAYAWSLLLAAPAVVLTLSSPVVEESSVWVKAYGFIATIAPRCMVLTVPIALVLLMRLRRPWVAPAALAALVVANALMWAPLGMPWAWKGLDRQPDTRMVLFTQSADFDPGATYRILRIADGKIGMYQMLQGGGRLDSEFFPESIDRRSWPTPEAYLRFLDGRRVDYVMIWQGYDTRFRTNEHALLQRLAATPCVGGEHVERVRSTLDYQLFHVREACHHS
ncbi:MAG TPA: hypothetical protein VGO78_26165 [Acidimicrobiales bacterium]|nr:hypothetical protein [Acidimicrobiales bacterium]